MSAESGLTNRRLDDDHGPADHSESDVRRYHRHAPLLFGMLTTLDRAGVSPPENPPSVPTWECSPISGAVPEFSPDLSPPERDALGAVFALGVDDVERAAKIVAGGGDRLTAIYAALEREDPDRREKVLALLERDAVGHALRLATCGRRSVQLECPELGGGCGFEENYVPLHCDSPLCDDCAGRRVGQTIERWKGAIRRMERPTFLTPTIENVEDPAAGREAIVDALAKLRRRTIPFEGRTVREGQDGDPVEKRWCWDRDGGRPADRWKAQLLEDGADDLARRLQKQYVRYEWEDATGHHQGKAIPFEELHSGGIYGIDVKQVGPNEYNVHVHLLIDMVYVPQAALSAVWEDITGDPYIDVRRIYDRGDGSAGSALAETVGYAAKPPEFESLEDRVEFVETTKHSPLIHPFGALHGQADDGAASLLCGRCEVTPAWWEYLGVVDDRIDTMGKGWETKGDRPPPE